MRSRLVACLVTLGLSTVACGGSSSTSVARPTTTPVGVTVVESAPPPGMEVAGAYWIKIRGAGGVAANEQVAAVFKPSGPGPFPLVIELHGSRGLKNVDVEWAARLAQTGFVTVAGCWHSSTVPPDTFQFFEITLRFIACPKLQATEVDAIAALIAAGQKQHGVRSDAVGMYGMSAGGAAALNVLASRGDIRAAVVDSGTVGGAEATKIKSPVLILAGTADASLSSFTAQKDYVEALQHAGKHVEWHYYEGGRHTLILDPANKDDAIKRIIDYLNRQLSNA